MTVPLTATASLTTDVPVDAVLRAVMALVPAADATKIALLAVIVPQVRAAKANAIAALVLAARVDQEVTFAATIAAATGVKNAANLPCPCQKSTSR